MAEAPHEGTILADRYELVRHIARGGMGDVYEGEDLVLRRRVAVKVFRSTAPADRERFDAEVRVLASLNHPGLVPVFDAGSVGEDAFLVMELVEGPPFRDRMQQGPMAPVEVADLGAKLAEALEHIHGRGVVHRDVTPANVLCDGERPRLVDFGIARLLDAPRITSPELAVGTAAYMAPEQVQGHDVSGAADIYSLGLLLLEALTGDKAFPGSMAETSIARLARDPDTTTGVPAAWQPLLGAMTARDPRARPPATAVRGRLAALAGAADRSTALVAAATSYRTAAGRPAAAPLALADRRRRRALPVWGAGAVAAAVVAGFLLLGGDGGTPGEPVDAATTSTIEGTTSTTGAAGSTDRSDPRPTDAAATAEEEAEAALDLAEEAGDDGAAAEPIVLSGAPETVPPRPTTTTPAPTTTQAPTTTTPTTAPTTTEAPAAAPAA